MEHNRTKRSLLFILIGIIILSTACSSSSNLPPTPTPTLLVEVILPTPTTPRSMCEGLAGALEMQVLVGPAEVVGLEPVAVGNIPFTVVTSDTVSLVEGGGDLVYHEVLEQTWGTYTVNFDQVATIAGECKGDEASGVLNLVVTTTGEQLVEVVSEGFQGEYPWSGTNDFDISLPIEEGATAQGEGWIFVLHLTE